MRAGVSCGESLWLYRPGLAAFVLERKFLDFACYDQILNI